MAKDRARDDRRSVGSHEKMTAALGRAAGWTRKTFTVGSDDPNIDGKSVVTAQKNNSSRSFVPGRGNVNDNELSKGVTYGGAGIYGAKVNG